MLDKLELYNHWRLISQDAVSETNISLQVLIVGNSEMNSGVREEAEMGSRGIEH